MNLNYTTTGQIFLKDFATNFQFNEIFRFLVAGVSSNLFNYVVYISALFVFEINPLVASGFGFLSGLVIGFVINRDFTFGSVLGWTRENLFIKYFLVQVVSLMIYIFITYICNSLAIMPLELLVFPAIFVCAGFNFVCCKFLVFR